MQQTQQHNWNIRKREEISNNKLYRATKAQIRNPRNGMEKEFFRLELPPWVNILALTPQKEIVLVRQFRFGSERMEWEVPGGVVEPGETALEAGVRELKEESGFIGKRAEILGEISPNPAIQTNTLTMVLVEEAVKISPQQLDPMEDIEVEVFFIGEVLEMIRRNILRHSFSHTILLHYFLQKEKISW